VVCLVLVLGLLCGGFENRSLLDLGLLPGLLFGMLRASGTMYDDIVGHGKLIHQFGPKCTHEHIASPMYVSPVLFTARFRWYILAG
jgi:hypothetical protein